MNKTVFAAVAAAMLSSCNGIFEGIYDAPTESSEFGFVSVSDINRTGIIYVDATAYTDWHYIDLRNKRVESIAAGEGEPQNWDFAIHRYDVKTNGGAAADSGCDDFTSAVAVLKELSEADFVADEWTTDRIATDMSQMMDGVIVYAEDFYNQVISRWLDVDTSTMPPVYTLSHRVYLLRLQDGSTAALRLADFMNSAAVKGFMTVEYRYPL